MLLHLVKKDILIAKKYVLVITLFLIAFPLFVTIIAPQIAGSLSFLYMIFLAQVVLLQAISQEEAKYPKAIALLCASPYPRSTFVKAKYTFFLLVFAYCYIVHTIIMLIANKSNILDLTMALALLLLSTIIYGIYIPIELKFGFIKAKFFFTILIMMFAFGPIISSNLLSNITFDFSALTSIPSSIKNLALGLMSIIVLGISMAVSIKIYSKKEL